MPKTICLGINPILFDSQVTGSHGPGLPFEDTPATRARNQCINDLVRIFAYKQLAETHSQTQGGWLYKLACVLLFR